MKRLLPLLLPIIFLAACDTEPARDVTEHEATLTAKGRCGGTYHVDWWYELRGVGGEFARVGPVNSFDCPSAWAEHPLSEHRATGLDSGTTYEYRVAWRVNDQAVVYADRNSANGTDWERFTTDHDFSAPGPCQVEVIPDSFSYTSSFEQPPQQGRDSLIRLYKPIGGPSGPRPVLLFHRGRTFTHTEYEDILSRVASHCFVVASVQDPTSFVGDGIPDGFYDSTRPDAGMEFACAALEGAMEYLRTLDASHPLYGRLDLNRVFMAGHSRGGGAAQACQARGYELGLRGVLIWMGVDLRYYRETVPPGVPPAYGIPDAAPSIPSLVLIAQKDWDAGAAYPQADQFFERMTGPATSVVMYGAIHNYASDNKPAELLSHPGITREEQHDLMVHWTTAFLKRWGDDDLSVDGVLYGNEASASQSVAVISPGKYAGSVVIDDFQDADALHNRLGGANTLVGASSIEESSYPPLACYPPPLYCPAFGTLPIRNNIITFNNVDTVVEYATQ